MVIFHNMHSCPSKHGIHKISSLSGTYGNNLHIRLTLDFLVIFPYASHAIGDGNGSKAGAKPERSFSNAYHAVWDGDGGKARATIERTLSNARHTVGDGDGGEA